jgi:hypothetical protein
MIRTFVIGSRETNACVWEASGARNLGNLEESLAGRSGVECSIGPGARFCGCLPVTGERRRFDPGRFRKVGRYLRKSERQNAIVE